MNTATGSEANHEPGPNNRRSLWAGILSGPIAWILQLVVGYGFVPYACDHGTKISLYILAVAAALLTVGAGYVAWTQWRLASQQRLADLIDPANAASFLSGFGVLMSLLFFVLIAATGLAGIMASPCPLITMKLP